LRNLLIGLQGSLWLVPAAMSALAFLLAYGLLRFAPTLPARSVRGLWWLFSGDAETAQDLLATLMSGMITMTSLVVSITVVVLTLAANQLGPRLVANFMADHQIKAVLGLFIGTILYLVTLLRSLTADTPTDQMPHLAITVGTALVVSCLFALLFYVHKVARSIIADTVVRDVARGLRRAVEANLPERDATADEAAHTTTEVSGPERWMALGRTGYIQVIDYQALVATAEREDVVIRLDVRPGHFVLSEGRHVAVLAAEPRELAPEIAKRIVIGAERSPAQDIEYAIRQLVEVALRALSPGINDPFTAIAVIDHLGGALADVLGRPLPQPVHRDDKGRVRVLADVTDIGGLLDAAFNQIRQAGKAHAAVLIELADILGKLAPLARGRPEREGIARHLAMVERAGGRHLEEPGDVADLAERISRARQSLGVSGGRE
jgi:uncharacterized membrane protein